ncbi:Putative coenzyme F420-dependent oxidoreductase [Zhongshania aliphaticivorans]|uniref:Coenzyme F420-dependent oxidoreductase n=1 Tax=Zhongshania aliphaticivorans TaxID=1470434 RepID=A0A5S9Q0M6_9GAMM|nr:LLM class flavin-dependent oxidoreductase [Zhongshania aliphaticivorans]CAA0093250.1 Putative coenzyme F420-dependent oxidoreductase [Zhongshania aliphaticivorans]CAA0111006.1 Putative coenzyme F420-dependent oxidoreductase [Zhongshania aliphaticivorans]
MTPNKRLALTLPSPDGTVAGSIAAAQQAEALGYQDVWLADAGGLDALTLAPLLLEHTKTLRVGIAVIPIFTRTPAVLASTFSVLAQAYPGRFIPGLGTSSHAIIEGWHGLPFEKPVSRTRETMALLRTILAGEKTHYSGEILRSHGYRQAAIDVPVYLAALRPRMLETAAEIGDGVILNLYPRGALPKIIDHIRVGAERAGKNPDTVEIVSRQMTVVTEDKASARAAFRATFSAYYSTPVYNKFLAWCGYEDAAREIREGWASKDRERTAAALPDELVDDIAFIGSAGECQQNISWCADQGVHTQIISCVQPSADIYSNTVKAFGAEQFVI